MEFASANPLIAAGFDFQLRETLIGLQAKKVLLGALSFLDFLYQVFRVS